MLSCILKCFKRKSEIITPEMEANRCAISATDCHDAIEYIDACLELEEKDKDSGASEYFKHREGLLIAAIVSYSRAFTESRGMGFATTKMKVNLGKVFSNNEEKIKLHKLILDRRNKAVAHSDWKYHQTELVDTNYKGGVLRRKPVVMHFEGIDVSKFKEIAENMRAHFMYENYRRDVSNRGKNAL